MSKVLYMNAHSGHQKCIKLNEDDSEMENWRKTALLSEVADKCCFKMKGGGYIGEFRFFEGHDDENGKRSGSFLMSSQDGEFRQGDVIEIWESGINDGMHGEEKAEAFLLILCCLRRLLTWNRLVSLENLKKSKIIDEDGEFTEHYEYMRVSVQKR